MQNNFGKLASGFVWLFALAAVLLGIAGAYATADFGSTVSSAVYFGIFAIAGFAGAAFTKAKGLASVGAFLLAACLAAGAYYWVTMQTVAEATNALGAGGEAGGMLGAAIGIFVAVITFVVSLTGGIGGVMVGLRARKQITAATAAA
jgi:hypothetical protein